MFVGAAGLFVRRRSISGSDHPAREEICCTVSILMRSRGQFDGKWDAVKVIANLCDRRGILLCHGKVWNNQKGAVDEESHGFILRELFDAQADVLCQAMKAMGRDRTTRL